MGNPVGWFDDEKACCRELEHGSQGLKVHCERDESKREKRDYG